jgi:hypothetical protein
MVAFLQVLKFENDAHDIPLCSRWFESLSQPGCRMSKMTLHFPAEKAEP